MYVKDPVLIKSNRYGITIYFDHDMPYEELLAETGEKFRAFAHFFHKRRRAADGGDHTGCGKDTDLMYY